jgi:signal peptidase II
MFAGPQKHLTKNIIIHTFMKRPLKIALFCFSSIAFVSCDRLTKELAKEKLMNTSSVSYFHDVFRLEYVENTGAAFGLGQRLPATASFWLLSILPLMLLLALFGYTIKQSGKMSFVKMFALALVIAGGIGNIIDRIVFDRHVTDFMNIGILSLRTEVFNVADVCVTMGGILLLLLHYYRAGHFRSMSSEN